MGKEEVLFFYVPIAFLIFVVFSVIKLVILIIINKVLAMSKTPFSRPFPGGKSIVILGDSTAVGTGSRNEEETLAGRLARDFPHTSIINLSENGSKTGGVLQQIEYLRDKKVDMAIISTGGNDVWAGTSSRKLAKDLYAVLELANEISGHRVILLFFGNEGSAPFFPWPIRSWLGRRTERVKDIFLAVAAEQQVPIIDLFSNPLENPFVIDPKRYFARDRLHPSGAGYGEWYKRMWRIMVEHGYLYHETGEEEI
jgi:lysophospholipase L1-like esterase